MPWWIIPLFTMAGLLVGLIYHLVSFGEDNIFESMMTGEIEASKVSWKLLNGFITLIGGFSLGPEAPAGLMAGGLTSVITKRRGFSEEDSKDTFIASVSGAFGGLFTSPFVGVMMALELSNPSRREFTRALAMDSIAAVSGFAIFYTLIGVNPEIGFINLPSYDFQTWHILLGIFFGLVGTCVGLIFVFSMKLIKSLLKPLQGRPLIKCTMMGFLLGTLAFALPLSLFFGLEELAHVFEFASTIGIVVLLLAVIARILATSGALATGFVGGPIFPTFFMGGTLGTIFTLLFPEIPIALSAGALAAAIPAVILPIPLSISLFAMMFLGLSTGEMVPVVTAGVVSYVLTQSIKTRMVSRKEKSAQG
ncbi:MAG: chloride channel protein [Methanomassiliicoccales archaeon]|nr:chloride channel protein [Methanomassiliicoccales archaeon]